jgi:hypothetical protein
MEILHQASGGRSGVEQSTHYPVFKGLNPINAGTARVKITKKTFFKLDLPSSETLSPSQPYCQIFQKLRLKGYITRQVHFFEGLQYFFDLILCQKESVL